VSQPPSGLVRLLTTAGGRVLCLAGSVDAAAVEAFSRRYGREPAVVDAIDARSVTALSPPGRALVQEHLDVAARAGRPVPVRASPDVAALLRADQDRPAGRTGAT
jgi:hypothetical protein